MSKDVPVIMMGVDFWQPLADWMEKTMLNELKTINKPDLDLWTLTDNIDEAVAIITQQVDKQEAKRVERRGSKGKTPEEKLTEATRPMAGTEQ